MKEYQLLQLNRLKEWNNNLVELIKVLPEMLYKADENSDFTELKKLLNKWAWERLENYKQFNNHSVRALHNQSFENDLLWGQVGELLDFFMTKQQKDLVMDWKKDGVKGIDFFTPSGWEDTKWSLHKWTDFPIELRSTGTASHHWKYVDNGQPVYLRFLNQEGCWRIRLDPEMKKQKGRSYNFGASELYDCPKEKFEKVWEW